MNKEESFLNVNEMFSLKPVLLIYLNDQSV